MASSFGLKGEHAYNMRMLYFMPNVHAPHTPPRSKPNRPKHYCQPQRPSTNHTKSGLPPFSQRLHLASLRHQPQRKQRHGRRAKLVASPRLHASRSRLLILLTETPNGIRQKWHLFPDFSAFDFDLVWAVGGGGGRVRIIPLFQPFFFHSVCKERKRASVYTSETGMNN